MKLSAFVCLVAVLCFASLPTVTPRDEVQAATTVQAGAAKNSPFKEKDTLKSLEEAIEKLEKADKAFPNIVFAGGHPQPHPPPFYAHLPHMPLPRPQSIAQKMAAAAALQKKKMSAVHKGKAEIFDQVIQGGDCKFELDGAEYDLNPLRLRNGASEYVTQDAARMIYKLNVCGMATTPASDCQRSNGMICQYDQGPAPIMEVIARWNAAPYPIWSYIDEGFKDAGVKLAFRNGDDCSFRGMKKTREAVINFPCDKEVGHVGTITVQEVSTCNYVFTVPTALSCMENASTTSFGWYFIFFTILIAVVYIVGGLTYNKMRHKLTGMEAFPHLTFWKDLPALVKDGVQYTWSQAMCYTCRQNSKAGDDL